MRDGESLATKRETRSGGFFLAEGYTEQTETMRAALADGKMRREKFFSDGLDKDGNGVYCINKRRKEL